jgi:undecaprenyl phosphate-alpha-L-ara4N flippase subunit ArnE
MKTFLLILLSTTLSGAGQLLLGAGTRGMPPVTGAGVLVLRTWLALFGNGQVIAGLVCWALSTALWLAVLTGAQLSFVYCIGSLNYIVVPLLARWLFRENLSGARMLGMLIIFLGVMVTLYARMLEAPGGEL